MILANILYAALCTYVYQASYGKNWAKTAKLVIVTFRNAFQAIRGVFEKYRDCMLCTNNTCNSDKSFVF